jgi:hypothetical protein
MTRACPGALDCRDVPASLSDDELAALCEVYEPPLPSPPDPTIIRIIRALARQAAREDHAREIGD